MNVEHIDYLVEDPSMEVFLQGLLPRFLGDVSFAIYPSQCKEELLARLPGRLKGYAAWIPRTYRIVVLVDQDDDDCRVLKEGLEQMAQQAGLGTRRHPNQEGPVVINRIAIQELEAWYFGDWEAVCAAYPRVSPSVVQKARFRKPDEVDRTWEALERELRRAGYFRTGLRKLEAARTIVQHMCPEHNSSPSFHVFWRTMLELAGPTPGELTGVTDASN